MIFGTRPEAIKLAPVVLLMKDDGRFDCHVCVTAQHREMLDQVLSVFDITPDVDLNLMRPNQTLGSLSALTMDALDSYLCVEEPDLVLVQGDTTTVFCAALSAFYRHVPVGHVEAGLRTGNFQAPWPEEANRVLTSRISTLHFAPTQTSRQNLLSEGVPDGQIFVTGNTVIDALFIALDKARQHNIRVPDLPAGLQPGTETAGPRMVLITGHRRENFGCGFENICRAVVDLAQRFPDVHFVYPVHFNPNVREPVGRLLGQVDASGIKARLANVHLIDPLPYLSFVGLMDRSYLILTDSGGIQEEAPSLGKPVLVMRETTERPEAVAMGTVKLVGTDPAVIVREVSTLLSDRAAYAAMSNASNPYGDGKASARIIEACAEYLSAN